MNDRKETASEEQSCGCGGGATSNTNAGGQSGGGCGCGDGRSCGGKGKWIWIALMLAVAGVMIARNAERKTSPESPVAPNATSGAVQTPGSPAESPAQAKALPRLVDLGATKCIPCKMMKPILDDFKAHYADHFTTEFIDVWENPEPGRKYGINVIPTQIFLDAAGKELYRHEGFFGKEDILAKWKEFGVDPSAKAESPPFSRWQPAQPDTRSKDAVCYLCDGDIPANRLVVVKTLSGSVASLDPATAVAWYGQRTKPDGTRVSAGCFHQGFFVDAGNLKKWVEANPLETGEMFTIQRALADKMKLTPQQISKACKIGECAPK